MTALSTALFYDRGSSAMQRLTTRSETLNTQIATGKKLVAPSDDPVAYQRLRGLADGAASAANVSLAQGVLAQADTTLSAIGAQLTHASELALQARNGTYSDADRASIAEELAGIADTIAGLANGSDARGLPLFGGAGIGAAVTANADGTHTLASSVTPEIPIGDGQSVRAGANAKEVLGLSGGRNVVDLLMQLSATLKAGGDVSAPLGDAITNLHTATTQASDVQASLGARGARLDLVAAQLSTASTEREAARSAIEDTDVTQAITELQKTMTVLQATQASFTKLSSLSLFDYLK